MARVVTGFSLEPEVLEALDEFSKRLGLTRSQAGNMIIKAALSGSAADAVDTMFSVILKRGLATEAQLAEEVEKEISALS
jgi:hypothetical protein